MTAFNQNFQTYPGDSVAPVFTVLDGSGAPINISTVAGIVWQARRSLSTPVVLTKSLGSGVTLVGGGVTGQFSVTIAAADIATLTGVYLHQAAIVDGLGTQSTVSLGQMTVGAQPTWTYDASQLLTSLLMQVRREVGDVNASDKLIFDEEINFAISQRNSLYGASAEVCRMIAANFSRQVDIGEGTQRQNYSQRSKAYLAMARLMESRARIAGPGVAYAGGISAADKQLQEQNTDRVGPNFTIGMTDNQLIPGDVGPETPGANREREWPDWA